MEAFYADIRAIHIASVIASGCLFLLRSVGHNLLRARWPMALWLRSIVWTVDTVLLTAALMLMTIVQQYPFADAWLTVKILLLVVYLILGWWAFRAPQHQTRILASTAAVVVFLFIVSVARSHSPLGIFA